MLNLFKALIALVAGLPLLWAGIGVEYWWDRRPAGQPTIPVHILFWTHTFNTPDSLKAKLDAARKGSLECRTVEGGLEDAIRRQNSVIDGLRGAGVARDQAAQRAASSSIATRAEAHRKVQWIAAQPATSCDAAEQLIRSASQ